MAALPGKLEPPAIHSTLMHAALMQLVHEFIKQWVIPEVKRFYVYSDLIGPGEWLTPTSEADYRRHVLDLVPGKGKVFESSAQWLENAGTLTSTQRQRLSEI